MSTSYRIDITMDDATVNALQEAGYSLYGFKAVQGPANGAPLVWFQTKTFSKKTSILWEEQYQAYSSETEIKDGVTIVASSPYDVNLGDLFAITGASGDGTITSTGADPLGIEIDNQTKTEFTVGISQVVNGTANAMCAFPLFGQADDVILPIEKVMLMFATKSVNTGAVIMTSFSQGAMIDLTTNNAATLGYVINHGWDTLGQPTMQVIPEHQALNALLVLPSPQNGKLALKEADLV